MAENLTLSTNTSHILQEPDHQSWDSMMWRPLRRTQSDLYPLLATKEDSQESNVRSKVHRQTRVSCCADFLNTRTDFTISSTDDQQKYASSRISFCDKAHQSFSRAIYSPAEFRYDQVSIKPRDNIREDRTVTTTASILNLLRLAGISTRHSQLANAILEMDYRLDDDLVSCLNDLERIGSELRAAIVAMRDQQTGENGKNIASFKEASIAVVKRFVIDAKEVVAGIARRSDDTKNAVNRAMHSLAELFVYALATEELMLNSIKAITIVRNVLTVTDTFRDIVVLFCGSSQLDPKGAYLKHLKRLASTLAASLSELLASLNDATSSNL